MKKKQIGMIVGTILLLIILFISAFLIKNKLTKEKEKTNTNPENNGFIEETAPQKNDPILTQNGNLMMNNLAFTTLNSCMPTSLRAIYYLKDYTAKTIPDPLKIYLGIMQYAEERKFSTSKEIILTKEEVKKGVQKVFGPDVTYKDQKNGKTACIGAYDAWDYDPTTGNYTIKPEKCHCDASLGEVVTKLVDMKETADQMVITYKMLVAVPVYHEDTKITTMNLYQSLDVTKKPLAKELSKYRLEDYLSQLKSYQFTFSKNKDGNFYFASVALLK